MLAVINACGKQYKVKPGDMLYLDAHIGNEGDEAKFDQVLLIDGGELALGKPTVKGAYVLGEVVKHGLGPKIKMLWMRRRKNSRKKMGHRQELSKILITEIHHGAEKEVLEKQMKQDILAAQTHSPETTSEEGAEPKATKKAARKTTKKVAKTTKKKA